jgi:DNA-binding NtrC family response regulator
VTSTPNPKAGPVLWEDVPMRDAVRAFKRELVLSRLERHNWQLRQARESLRLPRTTLLRYMTQLGITAQTPASEAGPALEK